MRPTSPQATLKPWQVSTAKDRTNMGTPPARSRHATATPQDFCPRR
ncbi:hypothetical protein ACFPN0_01075 [Kitasatospora cinereorecta]